MSVEALAAVLAFIALGTYFQTVTGFGFGMIAIGASSGLGLTSVAVVAAAVSLLTLVNGAVALKGRFHHVDRPAALAVLLGVVPATIAGVMLLNYLSESAALLLKFLLGGVVAFSGALFAMRPTQLELRSHNAGFFTSGVLAGLFGGAFGMPGPPVILHFYRQPMEPVVVRSMLILIIAAASAMRTVYVGFQGGLTYDVWLITGLAAMLVALATAAGRRFPPPLPPVVMRRIAFSVLIFIGVSLMAAAISEWAVIA